MVVVVNDATMKMSYINRQIRLTRLNIFLIQ